jgi:hypothetical protein
MAQRSAKAHKDAVEPVAPAILSPVFLTNPESVFNGAPNTLFPQPAGGARTDSDGEAEETLQL